MIRASLFPVALTLALLVVACGGSQPSSAQTARAHEDAYVLAQVKGTKIASLRHISGSLWRVDTYDRQGHYCWTLDTAHFLIQRGSLPDGFFPTRC